MLKTFSNTFKSLTYNIKTLLYFEIIYRALGVLIIYPIARLLFHASISLSGHSYITNALLMDYIKSPTTMFILCILIALFSFYIVIEMIFLAILFDFGHQEKEITLKVFLLMGFKRSFKVLKKYHLFIIGPAFIFLILVEFFHIVGIASTISFPQYFIDQINNFKVLRIASYIMIVIAVILFIETVFSLNLFTLEELKFKEAYRVSRLYLKKQRIKFFVEFIVLNLFLNAILYLIYLLVILIVGGLIMATRGQEYVLGFLLTALFSIYVVIGLVSTLILIPINYALIAQWYYQRRSKYQLNPSTHLAYLNHLKRPTELKFIKRGLYITLLVVFFLNITHVFSTVIEPQGSIEYFSYAKIIAHRGASKDAPENTLSAIELAIEQGADAVEFDVRLSKDLVPMLMHDASLRRTTNDILNRRIADVEYQELKTLDAGYWFSPEFESETIPTLLEALTLIDRRAIAFIELKGSDPLLAIKTYDIIESLELFDDVVILSFERQLLNYFKSENESIKTMLLLSSFFGDTSVLFSNKNIDYYGFDKTFVFNNPQLIDQAHRYKKGIYIWSVYQKSDIDQAAQLDFDGLITNQPVLAREIVYSINKQVAFIDLLRQLFRRELN